jgi:hypothetical protein
LVIVALGACGRLGFDSIEVDGSTGSDATSDAAPASCPGGELLCLDPSFNGGGGVSVHHEDNSTFGYQGVAVQPDGKIVVAGQVFTANDQHAAVFRFNEDGTTDTSFAGGHFELPVSLGSTTSVMLVPDGSIVGVGTAGGVGLIFWVEADGTSRTSFGVNGATSSNLGTDDSVTFNGIARDPATGDVFVGGQGHVNTGGFDIVYGRVTPQGDFVSSFTTTHQALALDQFGSLLGIDATGKIDLVGQSFNGADFDGLIQHVDPGTGAETEWADFTDARLPGDFRYLSGVHLPDGSIVATGNIGPSGGPYNVGITKLGPSSGNMLPPDMSFGTAGLTTLSYGVSDESRSIVRLADGRFLVGVRVNTADGLQHSTIVLVDPNGAELASISPAFTPDIVDNGVLWLTVDAQGRVVVLGDVGGTIGPEVYLSRLIVP